MNTISQTLRPESERTDDVVASMAVTLDGYLCRLDGSVDYLDNHPIEDFDLEGWASRVGALIMGRATYEQALGFGWAWGAMPTMVLTTSGLLPVPDGSNVRFGSAPTGQAIVDFAAETEGRLWVLGGGNVVTEGLLAGVIDTLDLVVIPEAIGAGVPLFAQPFAGPMRMLEAIPFKDGAVRLVYDVANR